MLKICVKLFANIQMVIQTLTDVHHVLFIPICLSLAASVTTTTSKHFYETGNDFNKPHVLFVHISVLWLHITCFGRIIYRPKINGIYYTSVKLRCEIIKSV